MVKILRKYNKHILVVGGVLLMVSFLIPQAIQQFRQNPENHTAGSIDGRKFTQGRQQRTNLEHGVLSTFASGVLVREVLGLDPAHAADHWLLLSDEAEQAGFVGEDRDGRDWVPEIKSLIGELYFASQYAQFGSQFAYRIMHDPQFASMRDPVIKQISESVDSSVIGSAGRAHLTDEEFYRVLAKARGVYRMRQNYEAAARVSDRKTLQAAKATLDAAAIDYAFVPASALASEIPDPDPAALQAHFDRFKSSRPGGAGADDLGIGYLLPKRVKIEYLTLNKSFIESMIFPDPVDASKRWKQNREKYKEDFAKEKPNVEKDIKAEKLGEIMNEANQAVRAFVLAATRKLVPDEAGGGDYKKLPPDWDAQRPKFEDIAKEVVAQVQKQLKINIPLPAVTIKTAEWLTAADLAKIPGIGSASLRIGGQKRAFADAALAVKELDGPRALRLQVGVPVVELPVLDDQGNRYYYTVVAARPESAPDSIDEIKDKAIQDYKSLQAFEKLKADADGLKQLAAADGLKSVADSVNARIPKPPDPVPPAPAPPQPKTEVQVRERQNVSRGGWNAPDEGVGASETVRAAIIDTAARLDPLTPLDQLDPAARTLTVPIPSKLGLLVVRITAYRPLTVETYRTQADNQANRARQEELRAASKDLSSTYPFSYPRMVERHAYKLERGQHDESDAEPAPAPSPADPKSKG